jgi:monoamine oxidase
MDVCVVGAGAAGLTAARTLRRAGLAVRVLEARGRLGGRAWTEQSSLGVPIDRGCAWLHSADINPWTRYARERGFTVIERSPNWQSRIGKESEARRRQWLEERDRAEAAIEAAARAGRDVAAGEVLPRDMQFRELFGAIMTWAVGAELEDLSTVDYANYGDTEANWSVREGLGAQIASAADGLDVELDCPVTAIDWSGPGVRLETPRGTVSARAAIVTAPTAVLARGAIRFAPALPPSCEEAFHNLPLGVADKVFVELAPGAMPLEGTRHIIAHADTRRTASVTVRPNGQELMLLYFGGNYAREMEPAGGLQDAARQVLGELFGSALANRIQRMVSTAWAGDPWSCGSYSVARPGFAHCRQALATPLADRLVFAGEACSRAGFGAVHGAWESGEAAAQALARVLRS